VEWKGDTGKKNPEQWDSCVVASNASSGVASKLICICYFDFTLSWEYDKRLWHTFFYVFSCMCIFDGTHSIYYLLLNVILFI
jgi:hypothetical protein